MGRQTELFDADAGTITYAYTGFGELQKQTDARGMIITTKYDNLGRLLQRAEPEGTTNYTYDTKTYGKGLPATVKRLNSTSVEINAQDFTYDSKSPLSSGKTTIKNVITGATNSYIAGYNYDNYGRLLNYTYPSGFMITHTYNQYTGELAKIEAPGLPNYNLIWQCNSVNALGQITQFNKGAVVTTNTYNPATHLLTDITTPNNFINLHYSYNNKLQLSARTDTRNGLYLEETFTYDALNRLHTITDDWGNVQTINYQDNGNIQDKTNVGQYMYDGDKIHALSQITQPYYDLTNMPNKLLTQNITYSSFGKALSIAEGNFTYNITYGTEQQRLISEFKETGTNNGKRTYYMGDYEIEENLDGTGRRERHYISGSNGLAAICEKVNGGAPQMHYVHTDIQGSWQAITTTTGVVEQTMNFDAWGRRRDPQTWENYTPSTMPGFMFNRGYTGHEHLDKFGLINMNGRMYDPLMARMLSPDNFVQAPTYSQSYNRYSYCFNNPLAFSDPSGWLAQGGNGGIVEGPYSEGLDLDMSIDMTPIITCFSYNPAYYNGVGGGSTPGAAGNITVEGDGKGGYLAVWNDAAQRYDYTQVNDNGGGKYNYFVYVGGELDGYQITYDCADKTQKVSDISTSEINPMTGAPYQGGALVDANWIIDITVGGVAGLLKGTSVAAGSVGAKTVQKLIKLNGGKNSVTIENATQIIRYDLAGKAHGGVPTPHMQIYNKNFVNGVVKSVTRASKTAVQMTRQDFEIVVKFLTGQ
jgi:RHS repeat-associated protein